MYLIGCLMAWGFGVLFIMGATKLRAKKDVHYEQCPTAEATVIGTHKFYGSRWMVRFEDETGEEVIGADDVRAESAFFPKKHFIPKRGNVEQVYYWKDNSPGKRCINDVPVRYTFHFCNEDFYILHTKRGKRRRVLYWIAGLAMFMIGIVILLAL